MATLEAEAMLLGIWKSIAELEDSITMDELEAILTASHEAEHRQNRFTAALKGVNLDEDTDGAKEKFEASQRRAQAVLSGKSEDDLIMDELGITMEVE